MSARVLMVGPFSAALVPYLPRPAAAYSDLRDGAVIVEPLAPLAPGTSASRELAEALGIEPWAFGSHAFAPERVDRNKLRLVLSRWAEFGDPDAIVERLDGLARGGFRFFFRPEG